MKEEYLEFVDEYDQTLGMELRHVIHEKALRHRAAHIFVFDSSGRLFLQKRSRFKDMNPSQWDSSAAGHVDPGESYEACIIREVREELGVELNGAPEPVLYHPACEETGQEFVWLFQTSMDVELALDPHEIETGGWFAPRDIDRWFEASPQDFSSSFALLWRLFSKKARA